MRSIKLTLAAAAVAALAISCSNVGTEGGDRAATGQTEVFLCVLTKDCGGLCGTQQEINVFLAKCNAGSNEPNPAGPCFSSCWNPCLHRASQSSNPNPTLCTLQCMKAQCPADAANAGLIHAGFESEACPVPDPASICPLLYRPVSCGGGCSYSNYCIAAAAGFGYGECTEEGGLLY